MTLSSAAIAVGALIAWWLPFDHEARICILVGSFGFVCYAAHLTLFGYFQQRLRQAGPVLAEVAGALVLLGCVALLAWNGAPVVYFVFGQALAFAAMLAVAWFCAWRIDRFRLRFEPVIWRDLLGRAVPLAGVDMLTLVYARSDTMLLALWATAEAVGLYGVASKIYDTCLGLSMLFVGLIGPILARRAHVDPTGFRGFLAAGWGLLTAGTVGIALMLGSFAPEFVTLVGGDAFGASADALRIFSLLIVIGSTRVLLRHGGHARHAAPSAHGIRHRCGRRAGRLRHPDPTARRSRRRVCSVAGRVGRRLPGVDGGSGCQRAPRLQGAVAGDWLWPASCGGDRSLAAAGPAMAAALCAGGSAMRACLWPPVWSARTNGCSACAAKATPMNYTTSRAARLPSAGAALTQGPGVRRHGLAPVECRRSA